MEILGIYLVDLGENIGGEINGKRYCIVISQVSKKDNTMLAVPITGKKSGTKYRGGFTIDNTKFLIRPRVVFFGKSDHLTIFPNKINVLHINLLAHLLF